MLKNTADSYGCVSKSLHWIVGLLIIALFVVGLIMGELPNGPDKMNVYALHKSFGIVVLFLAFLRLSWRFSGGVPLPLPNHQAWEKQLAKVTHVALYALMFAIPMTGWVMSSSFGYSVSVFGLFTLPDLVPKNPEFAEQVAEAHEVLAFSVIGLAGLHAAGAFKHHFIDKDSTLKRMLPAGCGSCGCAKKQD